MKQFSPRLDNFLDKLYFYMPVYWWRKRKLLLQAKAKLMTLRYLAEILTLAADHLENTIISLESRYWDVALVELRKSEKYYQRACGVDNDDPMFWEGLQNLIHENL